MPLVAAELGCYVAGGADFLPYSEKVVENSGFEPLTSSMPLRRSTN